jgi:hypothetical protein
MNWLEVLWITVMSFALLNFCAALYGYGHSKGRDYERPRAFGDGYRAGHWAGRNGLGEDREP